MAKHKISLNIEFCRSADKSFEEGVKVASQIGCKYIEPMVHAGYELLSQVNYFLSFLMEEDPLLMQEICDKYGMRISSISAHSLLMKPDAAVSRLIRAMVLASFAGCDFLNSDEMIKTDWMDDELAFSTMKYTLAKMLKVAARQKKYICIEPHGIFTKTDDGLMKIVRLVDSPWIKVNLDTGNNYLAVIDDPYEGLKKVRDYVYHIHAKDIDIHQSKKERGKVTGTPIGCACGEGVVDWEWVMKILEPVDREIFLSVECGKIDEAKRSLEFLKKTFASQLIEN